jgi:membrane-bound ClpP family serine protease
MEGLLLWGLLLLGVALLIVLIDLFVPSGGLLALVSLTVAIAGVVCLFMHDTRWGLAGLGLVVVGGPALFALSVKIFPHTPMGRMLILGGEPHDEKPPPQADPLAALIGKEGQVVTDLRPVGVVRIEGVKHDAVSQTRLVRAGETVRVVAVEGPTLKVRPIA